MQPATTTTVEQLADLVGGSVRGDGKVRITSANGIDRASAEQITYFTGATPDKRLQTTQAGAVVVRPCIAPLQVPTIVVDHPELAFTRIAAHFAPPPDHPRQGVHKTATIAEGVLLGTDVSIGANAHIGAGTAIGNNTVVYPNVYIGSNCHVDSQCVIYPGVVIREGTSIGTRVTIHPNVVIGADGFGYVFGDGRHHKVPQTGTVRIEDDVEIGACTCIDRGRFGQTVIGKGTKIDNLAQIAHNSQIGPHCIIAGQTGLSGSCQLGACVVLAGQVGVGDHVIIGDGVQVTAQTGVTKSWPAGNILTGTPAQERTSKLRQQAAAKRLPELLKQIKELQERVERLESTANTGQAG